MAKAEYEVMYINGWCAVKMNTINNTISTVWSRHNTKKEAKDKAKELNNIK